MTEIHTEKPILIDLPLPIETDRLTLRAPRFGDGAKLNEAKTETFTSLNKWMIWAQKPSTVEEDELTARQSHVKFLNRTDLVMFAFEKNTGQFVGGTGLHRFDWEKRHFEIGYWYRQSAQGKGYATEGTKALICYAFDVLHARKVIISHAEGNDASRRVIEKAGFEYEYVSKNDYHTPQGEFLDHRFYSLFAADHLRDFAVKWGGE